MVAAVFGDLLKKTMGLDAAAIGSSPIERAVQERMLRCLLPDARAYEEYLRSSESELQALIEAAVVPETWFFRDPEAFAEMARTIVAQSLIAEPGRVTRLLSLPCSTGEEPYSMAMALLEAGIPSSGFRVDAVDISARALRHARGAIYGRNSFRSKNLEFRDRYFEVTAAGHRLSEAVRELVDFRQGNLLAADFLPQAGSYDVIFCRNLLVYFDQATQARAIDIIQRLLNAAGVVFVGPAEAGMMFGHGFVWTKIPFAFAFRSSGALTAASAKGSRPSPPQGSTPPISMPAPSRSVPVRPLAPSRTAASAKHLPPRTVPIEDAAKLADLGRLVEATELCREHVRAHGPSAPAFHLMALVCSAAGNPNDAVQHFRKALYLDPRYGESLVHLALLLEKRGDASGALMLRDRLRRLERVEIKATP